MRNTRQRWCYVARTTDPVKRDFWQQVYGTTYLPVVNAARMISRLATFFGRARSQICNDIRLGGAPIMAKNVIIDVMPLGIPAPIVIERVL